jgi:hypothetical protein
MDDRGLRDAPFNPPEQPDDNNHTSDQESWDSDDLAMLQDSRNSDIPQSQQQPTDNITPLANSQTQQTMGNTRRDSSSTGLTI